MSDILLSVGLQKGAAETSQIQADLQSIISQLDNNPPKVKVGLQVDQSAINHFKSQLTQIVNSVGLSKGSPITVNISGLGEISTQASNARQALNGVAEASRQAANAINNMGTPQAQDALTQINILLKTIQTNYAKWTAAATGQSSAAYATYGSQIQALESLKMLVQSNAISFADFKERLGAIKLAASEAATEINRFGENKSAAKITVLEHHTEEYKNALAQCNRELVSLQKNQEQWTAAEKGRGAADYAALGQYRLAIEALIADLTTGKMTLDEFKTRFAAIKTAADTSRTSIRGFGEDTKSLGDRLKGLAGKFGAWLSVSQVIMQAIRAVRQMVNAVRDVDKAMTELKKVTNETNETYDKFLENASTRAKQIGASLSDVVTASADFARLGYSIDDAAKLADAALIYKNIGDGIEDITTASESIISTMQAFGIEASNVMSIVDKFNEVGNNFAISSAGIGEAMQRSAAAMASANNTIEETIALITAANTIVQNPESVGTTLKTVSMYLRAAKTEAEEAGESTDGMANSVSELRDEILQLTGQRVDIQIDEDTFKSTYQILKELSAVWDDLTDVSQANILELVGGKRNANVVSALLENFTVAEQALQTATKSAGSAIAENERQLESIEGKIAKFKAAFQTFSQNLIGSDTVKLFVDIGTALITVLDTLQKFHLLLPTILATFAAFKGIGLAKNLNTITNSLIVNKAATESLTMAVSQLTAKQKLRLVEDIKAAVASEALTQEEGQQILTALGLVAADGALTVANKGLAASFKTLMASIPVWGWVALGISLVVEGISLLTSSIDDSSDSMETLSEEAEQLTSEIRSIATEYQNLRDSATDIIPRFVELAEGVNQLGENVSLTDEEYEEFLSLNNQIAEMFPELNMGMDSNGNAMLALSFSADTLSQSLWDLVEAERAAANQKIADTMPDVLNNITQSIEQYDDAISNVEQSVHDIERAYNDFLVYQERGMSKIWASQSTQWGLDALDALGVLGDKVYSDTAHMYYWDLDLDIDKEELDRRFNNAMAGLEQQIANYEQLASAKWAQLNPVVSAYLKTDFMFQDLDGTMQEIAQVMVSGLDFSSLGLTTQDEVQSYIQSNIIEPLFLATPEVKKAFANITDWEEQLENGEITFEQFSDYITNAFGGLFEAMDSSEAEIFKKIFVSAFNQIGIAGEDFDTVLTNLISDGVNSLSTITDSARKLKDALNGMSDAFHGVTEAKSKYDAAMAVTEKDENFKSYAEAYSTLLEQIEAGTTNSNAFWASAEYIFGTDQLAEWGYGEGIEQIISAATDMAIIFGDANSAGSGLIHKLYEMSEAGSLVNEEGEQLINISKTADGGYIFDVDPSNLPAIADKLNITEDALLACFQALSMWGDVDFYDIEEVMSTIEEIGLAAETAGGKAINVSRLTEQMLSLGMTDREIFDVLQALDSLDGVTLLGITDDVDELKGGLIDLGLAADDGITVSVNYEGLLELMAQLGFTKDEAQETINLLNTADGITLTNASGEIKTVDEALAHIDTLTFTNVAEGVGSVSDAVSDVDSSSTDNVTAEINGIGSAAEIAAQQVYGIGDAIDVIDGRTATVYYEVQRSGTETGGIASSAAEIVDGIKFPYGGVILDKFKDGTPSAPGGPAVVGEEGEELQITDGTARLVGTNGPEIVNVNKGDRIYTAEQTRAILRRSGKNMHGVVPAYRAGTNNAGIVIFDDEPALFEIQDANQGNENKTTKINGKISGTMPVVPAPGAASGAAGGNNSPGGSGGSKNGSDEESWFERQYKDHNHWLEMDKESVSDYLDWLDDAYKKAYDEGLIDIDEFYKYEEEVLQKTQDLFKDHLGDIDHEISILEAGVGNSDEIITLSLQAIQDIEAELAAARAAGLDEDGDYIQYLEQQWNNYAQAVIDLREEAETEVKSTISDLVEYRIDMLKQEIQDQKDALSEQLDDLQNFYDKQREMLQDKYDEEKYLEEQSEKRKSVSDIRADLAMLEHDDSAWAQKRKLELQEQLADAEKELNSFEKDHALDMTLDMLDAQQAAQEVQIQAEMDALDAKLNDPHALFNQALEDIKNNTAELYQEFIDYNRKHGTGNDQDIADMWEEAYIADLEYQDTHNGEHLDGIEIGNYTGYVVPETSTPPQKHNTTASSYTQKETLRQEESKPSLENGSSIQVKSSATHFSAKSGSGVMASFIPGGVYTVYQTSGNEVLIGRDGVYTGWINKSDIVGYKSGTAYSIGGLAQWDEEGNGSEYIFESSDGNRYRMFAEGSKVLDADATNFLYNFATSGSSFISKMLTDLLGLSSFGNISKPIQAVEIHSGDIIVQGNATERTVSEIRRAQRENLKFVITEFNKLNK